MLNCLFPQFLQFRNGEDQDENQTSNKRSSQSQQSNCTQRPRVQDTISLLLSQANSPFQLQLLMSKRELEKLQEKSNHDAPSRNGFGSINIEENLQASKNGRWSPSEDLRYMAYVCFNLDRLQPTKRLQDDIRLLWKLKIYDEMAGFIGQRTLLQCYSHHCSKLKRHKHIQEVLVSFRSSYGSEKFTNFVNQNVNKLTKVKAKYDQIRGNSRNPLYISRDSRPQGGYSSESASSQQEASLHNLNLKQKPIQNIKKVERGLSKKPLNQTPSSSLAQYRENSAWVSDRHAPFGSPFAHPGGFEAIPYQGENDQGDVLLPKANAYPQDYTMMGYPNPGPYNYPMMPPYSYPYSFPSPYPMVSPYEYQHMPTMNYPYAYPWPPSPPIYPYGGFPHPQPPQNGQFGKIQQAPLQYK